MRSADFIAHEQGIEHPTGRRRVVPPHPSEQLDAFSASAAHSMDGAKLLDLATRAANAILDAQGTMTVGQVREQLGKLGKLENDGKEKLDGLGALGRRMGLIACGTERMSMEIAVGHANRHSIWRRPTAEERAGQLERECRRHGN